MRVCPACKQTEESRFKKHRAARNGRAAEYQCLECGKVFSETYGTPWYRMKIGKDKFLTICRLHYLHVSQRDIAARLKINKDSVHQALDRAGQYPDQVQEALVRHFADLDPRVAELIALRLQWRWEARAQGPLRPRARRSAAAARNEPRRVAVEVRI